MSFKFKKGEMVFMPEKTLPVFTLKKEIVVERGLAKFYKGWFLVIGHNEYYSPVVRFSTEPHRRPIPLVTLLTKDGPLSFRESACKSKAEIDKAAAFKKTLEEFTINVIKALKNED